MVDARVLGAVGDNTTDDTAAIQAVIDAVEALGGGVVLFPPHKSFKITSALTLAQGDEGASGNDVWLVGSGWTSEIYNAGTGNAITIGTTGGDRTADVRILNLLIRGQATSAHGIQVLRTHQVRIEGTRIRNNGGDGINFDRAYANWILNNYVNNNTGDGFEANNGNDFAIIEGNRFLSNGGKGVYFSNGDSTGSHIDRNDFEGNAIGVQIDCGNVTSIDSVTISGNYFENQVGKHIVLGTDTSANRIRNIVIASNKFVTTTPADYATNAVELDRVQYPYIYGNILNVNITTTANTQYLYLLANQWNGATPVTGGIINSSHNVLILRDATTGQVDFGTTADWSMVFYVNNAEAWRITDTASKHDLKSAFDGAGIVLTNAAGTVTKRVRLNDAGDGLIYEAE